MHVRVGRDPIARRCRAWIDGEEVTNRCFEAFDPGEDFDGVGYVHVYKLNAEGKKYRDPVTGEAAWEERSGAVRIEVRT